MHSDLVGNTVVLWLFQRDVRSRVGRTKLALGDTFDISADRFFKFVFLTISLLE